jgi:hypothetical protein
LLLLPLLYPSLLSVSLPPLCGVLSSTSCVCERFFIGVDIKSTGVGKVTGADARAGTGSSTGAGARSSTGAGEGPGGEINKSPIPRCGVWLVAVAAGVEIAVGSTGADAGVYTGSGSGAGANEGEMLSLES